MSLKPMKDQVPLFGEKKKTNNDTKEEILKKDKTQKLFISEKPINDELNSKLQINLENSFINSKRKNNLDNNAGRHDFDGELTKKLNYKFSKISNFHQNEPKPIFFENDLIFFNKKGSLIRFNESKEKVWISNNYTKTEKKSKPFLYLAKNQNILIVADSISKFYALNIINGDLIWTNNNSSSFNSEIKIYKDKFFVTDSQNTLHCFSIKDGREIWSHKTENTLIKSEKKLSIIINNNVVYFNNSIGDVTALNVQKGNLIWQLPTLHNNIYAESLSLKSSDLVLDKKIIYFSNNKNEFYAIEANSGILRWKTKINSAMRPKIIGNAIITITQNGFLIILDKVSGNIIRITDIFDKFKEKKRSQIYPVGFVVGVKKIYLTTTNGRLLIIDIKTGKNEKIMKIDGDKISKPFINKNKLFIIKDKAIIRFN